jgi:hypothetical protein
MSNNNLTPSSILTHDQIIELINDISKHVKDNYKDNTTTYHFTNSFLPKINKFIKKLNFAFTVKVESILKKEIDEIIRNNTSDESNKHPELNTDKVIEEIKKQYFNQNNLNDQKLTHNQYIVLFIVMIFVDNFNDQFYCWSDNEEQLVYFLNTFGFSKLVLKYK